MDRRSLLDDDATPTQERANVFSDDFEDDFDFGGVADGFRPNVDRETDSGARQDDVPARTVSAHYASHPIIPTLSRGPSRESTRKSRTQMNPFASPEDEEQAQRERPHSLEFEPDGLARRSTSSASSHVYARTSSPRFGAGPSHPYGMYQQGTMARTLSVATTSTIRPPPRQSFSHNVPQHPYALYPQGVDDGLDDDDDDDIQPIRQNPVPVGFPGLNQSYTRRIGPDGEDQDIIGEDGHTEQLPPYSRYPEDGPEKMPLLLPTALHSRAPVAGTDPGMPLMHTALQPTPTSAPAQSMTDASELDRQVSRGSMANHALLSSTSSETSSLESGKKSWKQMTWKERRRRQVCGIPCVWIMVAVFVVVFVLAVVGGAVGGFIAGNKHAQQVAGSVTTYYDASPISSPTGVSLPTGTFALTLGPAEEPQCDCLVSQTQAPAWSCDLAPNAALSLVVEPGPGDNGTGASVMYASYDTSISYGAQLINMNTSFASFAPVKDNDDPQNGPAFYFQQWYDKIVVVPEGALSLDSSNSKRRRQGWPGQGFVVPEQWAHRKEVIPPGEKPWFCVWNNTFLEGFIYFQENITTSTTTSAPSFTPPPSNMTARPTYTPPTTAYPPTTPSPTVPPDYTTTFTAQWTTATYTGPESNVESWITGLVEAERLRHPYGAHNNEHPYQPYGDTDDDDDDDDDDSSPTKRQISQSDPWSALNLFPYVIKLEERRVPNNQQDPYCQQYQILDNGNAGPVTDPKGNFIIIQIGEKDPDIASPSSRKSRRTVPGGCHCQWMSGE